jgi:hypothetical protein
MTFNVFRDGRVHVLSEECETCIFRPHERFVPGARVAEIVRETKDADGSTLICHSTIIHGEDNAICRGWFDRLADQDSILSTAKQWGMVEYDLPPEKEK